MSRIESARQRDMELLGLYRNSESQEFTIEDNIPEIEYDSAAKYAAIKDALITDKKKSKSSMSTQES